MAEAEAPPVFNLVDPLKDRKGVEILERPSGGESIAAPHLQLIFSPSR
jgi:hypothetical protein